MRNLFECQEVASGPGFGLAVADDAGDDQIGIVEGRAIGVRKRIAKFAAFVDGTRRFRRHMAGNAAGEGKLFEQPLHSLGVLGDVRIEFAVGAFEIGIGHQRRPAVAGAGDIDDMLRSCSLITRLRWT